MSKAELVFYQEDDRVPVLEWMSRLSIKARAKCLAYVAQLETFGNDLRRPVADYLRDGIYELRPSYQGVHYRLLYFFPKLGRRETPGLSQVVVVSHGLVKEGAVPDTEIERALERKDRFEADPPRHTFKPRTKAN